MGIPIKNDYHDAIIDIFTRLAIKYGWDLQATLYGAGGKSGIQLDACAEMKRDEQTLIIGILGDKLVLTISQNYPALAHFWLNSNIDNKEVDTIYALHTTKQILLADPKIFRKMRNFAKPIIDVKTIEPDTVYSTGPSWSWLLKI